MVNFDSGVAGYVRTYAVVNVNFPIDDKGRQEIACKHCPYLSSNERMCQLNKEPVAYPNRYVGDKCPLIEIENKEPQNGKNKTNGQRVYCAING